MGIDDNYLVVDRNKRRVWPGAFYATSLECHNFIHESGRNDLWIMRVGK